VARSIAISRAAPEQRELRRLFLVSALAHAALGFLLVFSPSSGVVMPQGVVAVELVSLPSTAPAKPAAKPAPAARPVPPPPPTPKEIVLPKETAPPKPEAPKAEPKPVEKPKPKAEPQAEPATEREYSDVLSELRAEVGDEAPAPAQTAAIGSPQPVGSPTGQRVSPEFLAWEKRARIHIRQNWILPEGFRNEPLRTSIAVDLDASGAILGEPRIVKRSGNPWYDDGVVSALQKASPLPAPPEAGEWSFEFVADRDF
jgi:protein TonB